MSNGYVYLTFNYNYVHQDGKRKGLRLATGIKLDTADWNNGWFALNFQKRNRQDFNNCVNRIEELKGQIWSAYQSFDQTPSPDQILDQIKNGNKQQVAPADNMPLDQWIMSILPTMRKQNGSFISDRSKQKFETVARMISALQALSGERITLGNFDRDTWNAFGDMMSNASCDIARMFDLYGIDALRNNMNGGYYRLTSKKKNQASLKQLLKYAVDEYDVDLPINKFKLVVVAKNDKVDKTYLQLDELKLLVDGRQDLPPYLDNARQLLVLACFLGCRFADIETILSTKVTTYKGQQMVKYTSHKTNTMVAAPVFGPVAQILNDNRPHAISNQKLNDYAKELLSILGIDREWMESFTTADGQVVQRTRKVSDIISSHMGRRTAYSMYIGHCMIPEQIVTRAITGHSNSKDVHTDYWSLDGEQTTIAFMEFLRRSADKFPFII